MRSLFSFSALLIVVVLVSALALKTADRLRPKPTLAPTAQSTLRLSLLSGGLRCVTHIAWSPNGKSVAVLGDTRGCGGSALTAQTSLLLIYNASTGEIIQRLAPDGDILAPPPVNDDILPTPGTGSDILSTPDILGALGTTWKNSSFVPLLTYSNLVWTPDSKALLLPFSVRTSDPQQSVATSVNGLLREGVSDRSLIRVWLDLIHTVQPGKIEQWDLTSVVSTLVPAPVAAAAYHWNSDGTLSADTAVATGAVGAPVGGASFTVWQPGSLGYVAAPDGGSVSAQDVGWTATVAAVSPDGRYFYQSVSASGSLVPPSTAPVQTPTLTPHDNALQTLAQQLTQAANPDASTALLVAWRPNGRLLATVTRQPADAQGAAADALTVSIYDTTTGRQVKQLTPTFNGVSAGATSVETLQWSPDGKYLLLADSANGVITIWGPSALPA